MAAPVVVQEFTFQRGALGPIGESDALALALRCIRAAAAGIGDRSLRAEDGPEDVAKADGAAANDGIFTGEDFAVGRRHLYAAVAAPPGDESRLDDAVRLRGFICGI